jgi:transcriptional regulator with XRE-family HTH domain
MRHNDIKNLRLTLREAIRASGRTRRELEVLLHLGRGNLERLLDGTLRIRATHLLELAEILRVPPADFLTLGCPETTAAADRRLTDWIAPGHRMEDGRAAAPAAERPLSRAELAELIREEVRNALAGQERRAPGAPPAGSEPEAN